jgi:hypothetical protein
MTPDEIFPPLEANQEVVLLIQCGFYPRRCYPVKWYGLRMRWQVHNYCKDMSRKLAFSDRVMNASLWLETESGNDILLGQWRDGVEIFIKDPSTVAHCHTGKRGVV